MFMVCGTLRRIPAIKHRLQVRHSFKQRKEASGDSNYVRKELKYIKRCHVAIVGLGGVGKSLAHLLKMYPGGLTELRLCNRTDPEGMVEELSHIPTKVGIRGFQGIESFPDGLRDVDIVVVCAGIPRKENTPREQLFKDNASICCDLMNICADTCPKALIAIVTNPVDLLVPVAAEVLKKRGVYSPQKLFGVCHLDQMRAQQYYAEVIGAEPKETYVPVVGGHSETTTVPLFSKGKPNVPLSMEEMKKLVDHVRSAGKRVVEAKRGSGGSTYSMASAAMYFIHKLCQAIHHQPHLITSAYVESSVTKSRFFSNEIILGSEGVFKNLGYGQVNDFEEKLINEAVEILQAQIAIAEKYVAENTG